MTTRTRTRVNYLWLIACACAILEVAPSFALASPPLRDRRAFAAAMNKIHEGMSQAEVVALLGKPDDVQTQIDWGNILFNADTMWRYGASGHLQGATLGQVCFDQAQKVTHFSGQGTPPPEGLFTEAELRPLLEALFALPSYNAGPKYNPRPVIRAVNLLQPLGKEKALAAIDEFLRVSFAYRDEGREGVFLLLRTLFDVPDRPTDFPYKVASIPGYMPSMMVGASLPVEPNDKKLLPRFPITIEGDIPFLLVEGYLLFGSAEPAESHVAYFRKFGKLRAAPLAPTARPLAALEAFEKSPRWYFNQKGELGSNFLDREPLLLRKQVLNLLDTVYRPDADEAALFEFFHERELRKWLAAASKLAIRWDSKELKYTFLDGTSLPAVDPDRYRPWVWATNVGGLSTRLTIQRKSRHYVSLVCLDNYEVGKWSGAGSIRVYGPKSRSSPLFDCSFSASADVHSKDAKASDPQGESRSQLWTDTIRCDEPAEIQAELIICGKVVARSPVCKP